MLHQRGVGEGNRVVHGAGLMVVLDKEGQVTGLGGEV